MHLVFVHGWGFGAAIWDEIVARLPDQSITNIDLGFIGARGVDKIEFPRGAIIIGHSLGVLWLLKRQPTAPVALISISGFNLFSPPIANSVLELMKRGIRKNPAVQLDHFWRLCGIKNYNAGDIPNSERLLEGLDWLMAWDGRREHAQISCPIHVLGAPDDQVVPAEMLRDQWGEDVITWSDGGGHGLPLTRADWCADQIGKIIKHYE